MGTEKKKTTEKPKVAQVSKTTRAKTWDEVYNKLAERLPDEAVERTSGSATGKGYDTTGYKYQFVINRFNEVMGVDGWGYEYKQLHTGTYKTSKGAQRITVTVSTTIFLTLDGKTVQHTMVGGHDGKNYADTLKGAITNSLKKTAAMFGNGRHAYEVSIDDDNVPQEKAPEPPKAAEPLASAAQMRMIGALMAELGIDREAFKKANKLESAKDMTMKFASAVIESMQKKIQEKKEKEAVDQTPQAQDLPTVNYDDLDEEDIDDIFNDFPGPDDEPSMDKDVEAKAAQADK